MGKRTKMEKDMSDTAESKDDSVVSSATREGQRQKRKLSANTTKKILSGPTTKQSKMLPFFGKTHAFSQWHACSFTDPLNEVQYNCCEQFMMAQKASLFKDEASLEKIMASASPGEQKRLGRKVRNFDDRVWKQYRLAFVARGNLLKFSQNRELQDTLLASGDKIIVEACRDAIWGSGKPKSHPKAFDQTTWGLNLLGLALMSAREIIAKQGAGFDFVISNSAFYSNPKAQSDIIRAQQLMACSTTMKDFASAKESSKIMAFPSTSGAKE